MRRGFQSGSVHEAILENSSAGGLLTEMHRLEFQQSAQIDLRPSKVNLTYCIQSSKPMHRALLFNGSY